MKTEKKTPVSFSDQTTKGETVELTFPKSWEEMTQEQLRMVLDMMSFDPGDLELRLKLLLRFNGITVAYKSSTSWLCYVRVKRRAKRFFRLKTWQLHWMVKQLEFLGEFEHFHNHLESAAGGTAVDLLLHGVSFEDYLQTEKYYQLYISSKRLEHLEKLGRFLYRKEDGSGAEGEFTPGEIVGILFWYSWVKTVFASYFPHFFKRSDVKEEESDEAFDILSSMNAQIRALTEGDVTKEKEILQIDCWRALTELNEKAREGRQMKEKLDSYGKR